MLGPGSPQQIGERTAESGSRTAEAAKHERGNHCEQRAGSAGSQRSLAQRDNSAPCVAEGTAQFAQRRSGPVPSVSGGCVPQSGSSVCLHLLLAPPWALTDRPGGAGHLLSGPASGHCLGPSRGLAPGSHPSHKAPGAWGGAAAHLAESRTPGQGVVPASKPLIPALGRRVPRAGQEAQVFPAHPQITPHPKPSPARPLATPSRVARGVAARGLASRESEGA